MSLGVDILTLVASHITDSHIIANFCGISRTHLIAAGRGGINNIKGESISASLLIHLRTVASLDVDLVILDDESEEFLLKLLVWIFPSGADMRRVRIKMRDVAKTWHIISPDDGLQFGAAMGRMALVEFSIHAGADDWKWGMFGAAEAGHRGLVDFFIGKGAKSWNCAMVSAAKGGHRDLVDFFIGEGASDWNRGMLYAAQGGHRDLVDFFIDKGASEWNVAMAGASRGGHRDLVDFFIDKGARSWNAGMCGAAGGGHRDLVDFFISKGANDWNKAMLESAMAGQREMVDFFITKGADNWEKCMLWAIAEGCNNLSGVFREKLHPTKWYVGRNGVPIPWNLTI